MRVTLGLSQGGAPGTGAKLSAAIVYVKQIPRQKHLSLPALIRQMPERPSALLHAVKFSPVSAALIFSLGLALAQEDDPGEKADAPPAPMAGVERATGRATVVVKDVPNPEIRMFSKNPTLSKTIYLYADKSALAPRTFPKILENSLLWELPSTSDHEYECVAAGDVFALARSNPSRNDAKPLLALGFVPVEGVKPWQLYGDGPKEVFGLFRKHLQAGETFKLPAAIILAGFDVVNRPDYGGEFLYNGIRLPRDFPQGNDLNTDEPPPVPYLLDRPKLVYIDTGRQLFVDDFLVESSDLEREYHYPVKYEGNPVLKPETDLEKKGLNDLAIAGPKSGGLWWSPEKQLFEFWYEAGWVTNIAYATSKDGLHWERPQLPVVPGTNRVNPPNVGVDSWTVVRDDNATDPAEKFKIFVRGDHARSRARGFVSADGIDWKQQTEGGITGDRSTMFYNPFRKKWVFSIRWSSPGGRSRAYWEGDEYLKAVEFLPDQPIPWARTDKLDLPDPRVGNPPQLYNLDAVGYESIMLGFYEILHGPDNDVSGKLGLPKHTGLNFAYSRDGFHFSRPDRKMAINSEYTGVWDRGYVQSLGNLCLIRGDKLWFYYIAFAGDPTKVWDGGKPSTMKTGMYANGATGVAILRRDGFVSLNAAAEPRTLLTRPVTFTGRFLFANVEAPNGELVAEAVGMDGKVIKPFTFANCIPLKGDTTIEQIKWKTGDSLLSLAGRPVRFRFRLTNGKFYAFWVSQDESGRSGGYVAGGGPGFTSNIDTVGKASLEAEVKLKSGNP